MTKRRFVIEMGMGIDQHGQDPTVAASRAVRNAIAHNALPGIWEVAGLDHPNEMIVEVQVAVPFPEQVIEAEILSVLPFGQKTLTVEQVAVPFPEQVIEAEILSVLPFGQKTLTVELGGMVVQGRAIPDLNDKSDAMYIATAAVTVYVDI